jgi:hypothetical protein
MQNNNADQSIVDKYILTFHDVIKEILSQMDLETAEAFLKAFKEKMMNEKTRL